MSKKISGESKRKKIAVVIQGNVGGAERIAVTVTGGLDSQLYDVTYYLVGMTDENCYAIEKFIPRQWKVHHIKKTHSAILLIKFFGVLFKERPDTVFSTTLYINGKLLLLRKFFPNMKFIIRCENYLYTFKSKQLNLIRNTYKNADLIIAQTEEMKEELIDRMHIDGKMIKVLHNPIDKITIDKKIECGTNPYPQNAAINFCACGRLTRQKGFDLLIMAFSIVKETIPNAHLYIIGNNEGPRREYFDVLRDLTSNYGVLNDVTFLGYQENPYIYMKYADCFVLSSRWEGLPNVMLESLYVGTPVAAFQCIPIVERIINDGEDGFLAEKENVKSLSDAMTKACKLGRIKLSFKLCSVEDFQRIFSM